MPLTEPAGRYLAARYRRPGTGYALGSETGGGGGLDGIAPAPS
ncbi:hypothetical protein [Isoalcanivorax beigongshangi]|uniref:Uncharacterized protein n=1 Tax=Isoalcanivorax beigongshangi TaxID=3238810 RepID=A0ABV4AI13_9GAMM